MVVAGVYLVARLFPLFHINQASLTVVTFVGLLSAFLAAIIACTQTDIKRVLAYSTMSQIGYMMFALGVSGYGGEFGLGYTASMFHLFTHAFFKSLLFLGAGVVIHFIHSNEMKDMGGLRKYLPVANWTFLIACLAIAGIPPLSGFFSKEEILLAAYQSNKLVYGVALFTSGLTAFYMFRLYFSIFWNKNAEVHNPHGEASFSMKMPLIILAVCSALAGFIPFGKYISSDRTVLESHFDPMFSIAPVAFGAIGILLATWMYKNENGKSERVSQTLGGFYKAAYKKFYIDEAYLFITKKIIFNLIGKPASWIDRNIVDGTMNGIAWTTGRISTLIKGVQSGRVQSYALYFFGGIVCLVIIFLYLWK
jgi:NADH-quinone oxidoreductase subunit L